MPWSLVVSILALIVTILGASWKISSVVTENTVAVKELRDKFNTFTTGNTEDHREFRNKLEDHEKRITIIENTPK